MAVEIGSLVIRASFGNEAKPEAPVSPETEELVAATERRIREDMADMIAEALRRREER